MPREERIINYKFCYSLIKIEISEEKKKSYCKKILSRLEDQNTIYLFLLIKDIEAL